MGVGVQCRGYSPVSQHCNAVHTISVEMCISCFFSAIELHASRRANMCNQGNLTMFQRAVLAYLAVKRTVCYLYWYTNFTFAEDFPVVILRVSLEIPKY